MMGDLKGDERMRVLKKINVLKKFDVAELYNSESIVYNCTMCGTQISYYTWKEHGGLCASCDKDYR